MISRLLPNDAVEALRQAAIIGQPYSLTRAIAIEQATRWVKLTYPMYFRVDAETGG